MEKPPILKHPEVREDEKDLKEALETEALVFDYKVKQEEALAIFDEIKEYLTYENLVASEAFSALPEDARLEMEKHREEARAADPRNREPRVLFADFKALRSRSPEATEEALLDSICETERKKITEARGARKESRQAMEEELKARVIGRMAKLSYLLNFHFDRLEEELAAYDKDDAERISAYAKASLPSARKALSEIEKMREGIQSAKASKSVEAVRKLEETAKVHAVSEKKVKDTNERLQKLFKRKFGGKFEFGIEETFDTVGNLVDKDFITAYVNYAREMKNMRRLLETGEIVETSYVKDIIERAMPSLKKDPSSIVYLHGDFGTGKTALAKHIAKTRFGREPIIVSGSKYLDPERFTEEFRIQKLGSVDFLNRILGEMGAEESLGRDASMEEVVSRLAGTRGELRQSVVRNFLREEYAHSLPAGEESGRDDFEKYAEENEDKISERKLKDIDDEIGDLFSNQVQGRYVLGAMYQCMKEGRPLIIDEANAISPDVLIAFNDLLTKKIGERVPVRADEKEIKVREGYCIIWTGNTGERYKQARFNDMDPAAYSRITPINVRYLPQSREVNNMEQLMERLELDRLDEKTFADEAEALAFVKDSKSKAGADQIFQVLLLKLLNKRLGAEMLARSDDRYSAVKDIYRLSVAARIIMDMFEGRAENLPSFPNLGRIIGSGEPTVLMKKLKKSNLTMRELIDNIIGGYADEDMSMDTEFYAFKFIQKGDMHPEEQAILYAIMQKAGMFDTEAGWPDYQAAANLQQFREMIGFNPVGAIEKYKKIQKNGDYVSLLNTKGAYRYAYLSSPEALQLLFGYLPPRKKKEYEEIMNKRKGDTGKEAPDAAKQELINTIRECRQSLRPSLFKSVRDAAEFAEHLASLKLAEPAFAANAPESEFWAEVGKFNGLFLDLLLKNELISEDDYKSMQKAGAQAATEFIRSVLRKAA